MLVLNPIVGFFSRGKIPRSLVVSCILLITFGLIILGAFLFLTPLYEETITLLQKAPKVTDNLARALLSWAKRTVMKVGFIDESVFDSVVEQIRNMVPVSNQMQRALSTIWETAPRFLGTVVNLVMIPLITFFFLKDGRLFLHSLTQLVPLDLRKPFLELISRLHRTLRQVLKGQVMVAAALGILYIIGFNIVGIPSASTIGLVAGICRIVPYVDVIVGGALSIFSVFSDFHGSGQLLGVGLVFLAVQGIDGMIITPKVLGEKAGLHPLVVITSVIAFGDLWGFLGVLMAIPFLAILRTIFLLALPFYKESRFYRSRD